MSKDSGEAYVSSEGVPRLGKTLRSPCSSNCRFGCNTKITEKQREELFQYYYSLGNLTKQWQYLTNLMDPFKPKQPPRLSYRKNNQVVEKRGERRSNIRYYLPIDSDERVKVCQTMFIATFDISPCTVRTVLRKTDSNGVLVLSDLRGKFSNKKPIQV